jgi:hypothetical protein
MHGDWLILRLTWSAVVIGYFVLFFAVARRLRGQAKKRSDTIFWAVASLAVIRTLVRFALGFGFVYQLAVVILGVAAGIAALVLIGTLMTQKPDGGLLETNSSESGFSR